MSSLYPEKSAYPCVKQYSTHSSNVGVWSLHIRSITFCSELLFHSCDYTFKSILQMLPSIKDTAVPFSLFERLLLDFLIDFILRVPISHLLFPSDAIFLCLCIFTLKNSFAVTGFKREANMETTLRASTGFFQPTQVVPAGIAVC